MKRKLSELKPKTTEEAFNKLADYFLGPNYYIDIKDSDKSTQANAIIVDDIIYSVENELERIRHAGLVGLCFSIVVGIIIGIIIGLIIGGFING